MNSALLPIQSCDNVKVKCPRLIIILIRYHQSDFFLDRNEWIVTSSIVESNGSLFVSCVIFSDGTKWEGGIL